jgi:TRAP transporter TAXI family solute receptor
MTRGRRWIFALGIAGALAAPAAPVSAQEFVNVLTGGTSGVYYPLGVALSNLYGKALPGARVSTQATKASVENLNLLNDGKGEVAFTLGDSLSAAWTGNAEAGFAKKLDKLRGMAAIYPNYIQIVASGASGIKTMADLKGKRISVGAPKSGTELNARAVLAGAGLKYSDFSKVEYIDFGGSVDLLKNRQIDVTLQSAGLGVASIRDLANSIEIVLVPVPADIVAKIGDPAYVPETIPAGTYSGQAAAVPAVAVRNFLVTHSGVKADTVYAMTKAMFDNQPAMEAAHSAAKSIKMETAASGMPLPLHPGAERFYKEKGLLK